MPTKAKEGDACYDLCAVDLKVENGYIHYDLGIAVEIPEGWQALIFPRSSISNTDLVLTNGVGVVDSGYRGPLGARFKLIPRTNTYKDCIPTLESKGDYPTWYIPEGPNNRIYQVGDRVCQIQFLPLPKYSLKLVEELSPSDRGEGGFGHSGK